MTYKAILRGNRLEWSDEKPEGLTPERELPVIVTILDEPKSPGQGSRMAEALRKLADAGGVRGIEDPLQWERDFPARATAPSRTDADHQKRSRLLQDRGAFDPQPVPG